MDASPGTQPHLPTAPQRWDRPFETLSAGSRPYWTAPVVIFVGTLLIGAATAGAIVRDYVNLEMQVSKQVDVIRQMRDGTLLPGR